jgi:hypothetical protein
VDDSADPTFRTVTLDTVSIDDASYGRISFGGVPIQYKYAETSAVILHTGSGGATVNVLADGSPTMLTGHGPNTTIKVGNGGVLYDIVRDVIVSNSASSTDLVIDDSTDPTGRTVVITNSTVSYGNPAATIRFSNLASLNIEGGPGSSGYHVSGPPAGTAVRVTGRGLSDAFDVAADNSPHGPLSLHAAANSNTFVRFGDGNNSDPQTYTFTAGALTRSGPAAFYLTFDNVGYCELDASQGPGTVVNVQGTAAGTPALPVVGTGGHVNVGNGGLLTGIQAAVSIFSYAGAAIDIRVDNSADTTGRTAILRTGAFGQALLYSAQAAVFWQTEPGSTARVLGGSGDTFVVEGTRNGTALRLVGGKGNTLDYRPYPDGNVLVNLQTGKATGFTDIANIQYVFGASGPGGYNILVGNGGDVLTGGNGRRNLLIAGAASSTLIGGDGEDILIGGSTDYDTNLAALQDIMAVWTGAGLYQDRVNALTNDPLYAFPLRGGTGGPLGTVHSNGGGNTLTGKPDGSTALDLYFGDPTLDANDSTAADTFITIV